MACPNAPRCPLFPEFKLKPTLEYWLLRFCNAESYPECERFKRSQSGQAVPPKLLPSGQSLP